FGIPLGDNFVSADTKRTFAVIAVPSSCSAPKLTLQQAIWEKPDGRNPATEQLVTDFAPIKNQMRNSSPPPDNVATGDVRSVSFNRASYDPTKYTPGNPVLVAVSVTLGQPIDQQATLYAHGILL